jgi:RNA polymerase sigma-70 factor (ECF subfamily)
VNGRAAAYAAAERAARESYGKLLAYLAARSGNVDAAADALADAFAVALERWPVDGVPRTPDAWLLVAARHRLFDGHRRGTRAERLHDALAAAARDAQHAFERVGEIDDERLGCMFACTHDAVAPEMHAPLMLQLVLGLDAARIASAFLVAPAAMGQRLVRAKRKIAAARIPLRIPGADELPARLDGVLSAIYAAFSAGWSDPAGVDPRMRGLAGEALWLGRLVCDLVPDEAEALGLLALMLHGDARRAARRGAAGAYIPLAEQDPARWNAAQIDEAESLLRRAGRVRRPGRFQLEAAIQSAHAERRFGREPAWDAIVLLYDALHALTGSPVVALNRAVALGYLRGPRAGIAALAALTVRGALHEYQPYWAARAELLARAGEHTQARAAYERAIGLCADPAVRNYLLERADEVPAQPT